MHPRSFVVAAVFAALLTLGVAAYALLGRDEAKETADAPSASIPAGAHVVTLTDDGFAPSMLSIRVGETVAFRNETGKLFWPASNLHPSHLIYAEFDPKQPVAAGDVWSFTFTKAGEWQYHDHLSPYYTGVITVSE